MSNATQVDPNEPAAASDAVLSAEMSMERKCTPGAKPLAEEELFGFRAAIAQSAANEVAEAEAKAKQPPTNILTMFLLLIVVAGGGALLVFGAMTLLAPKPPSLYIDLGTMRYEPAGLGGRLIAQWTGNATYKLTIDPVDPTQIPGFHATVANPPHAITFKLILKDASARIACQKDIVISGVPQGPGTFDAAQTLAAHTSATGDTVQNVAGNGGIIGESVLTGALPCDLEAYKKIVAWEFSTDFPPLGTQEDWERHEEKLQADAKKAKGGQAQSIGGYFFVKSLPAPIEGDDVIVGDNPSKGVVETGSGKAFLVGREVLVNPALDWQVFPADIHYRCERNATCMLTRLNSRSALRAHLMK